MIKSGSRSKCKQNTWYLEITNSQWHAKQIRLHPPNKGEFFCATSCAPFLFVGQTPSSLLVSIVKVNICTYWFLCSLSKKYSFLLFKKNLVFFSCYSSPLFSCFQVHKSIAVNGPFNQSDWRLKLCPELQSCQLNVDLKCKSPSLGILIEIPKQIVTWKVLPVLG